LNFGCFCLIFGRHDRSKGVEILVKDLKVFSTFNEELFKEITQLLTLENFRYNDKFFFFYLSLKVVYDADNLL
jgi:hypothetical protein